MKVLSIFSFCFQMVVIAKRSSSRSLRIQEMNSRINWKSSWKEMDIEEKNFFSLPEKYVPRTPNQQLYVNYLQDSSVSIVVGVGAAGTGKTLFACNSAIESLRKKEISKIIFTRPLVTVDDENIGFLPGTLETKMNPWLLPLFDIFLRYYNQREIDKMLYDKVIEICPLGFMRGRTFTDTYIIADELQNCSPNQMLMLTTRLGKNSKLVMTGDLDQCDLITQNGLDDFLTRLRQNPDCTNIQLVEFQSSDVQRSEIVKTVLHLYASFLP